MGGGFESGQCSRALFVHFQRLWGKGIGFMTGLKNREKEERLTLRIL